MERKIALKGAIVRYLETIKTVFIMVLFLSLFILLIPSSVLCLTIEEIKQPGGDYFWGEGRSRDRDEAREMALRELAANVASSVSSSFESIIQETNADSQDFLRSVVNVNSVAYFRELQPMWRDEGDDNVSLYFIHRDYLRSAYEERRQAIISKFETAQQARESANISTALQFFYQCIILMNSIPDRVIDYQGQNLRDIIPLAIRSVMDNISIVYEGDVRDRDDARKINLRVTYRGRPVQCLYFVYLEGGQENNSRATGGRATCELYRASVDYTRLDVEIEYRFANTRDLCPYVNELWSVVSRPSFDNKKRVDLREATPPPPVPSSATPLVESSRFEVFLTNDIDCPPEKEIKKELLTFLEVLNGGEKLLNTYAHDNFLAEKLKSAFKFNRPTLIDNRFQIEINKTWDGWEVRSIAVSCHYPSIATRTVEYLVLDFDEQGKLIDFNFNVFDELYRSFVDKELHSDEELLQRQVIVKFLERYRTAFLNRDLDTLEKIIADEAYIIVGRVLQRADTERHYELDRGTEQVEYQQFTKKEYLDRQRTIFARQRDIHLGFNTFNINKRDTLTGIYGVSMRQQYASSGYADEGYLFLLIDFVEDDPKIYVRSWQPQEWSEDQLIRMSDFRVLR